MLTYYIYKFFSSIYPIIQSTRSNAFINQTVFYDSNPCDPFTIVSVYSHHKSYLLKTQPIWSQLINIYVSKNSHQKQLFYFKVTKENSQNLELNCHEPRKKKNFKNIEHIKKVASECQEGKRKMILGPFFLLEYELIFRFQQRHPSIIFYYHFLRKRICFRLKKYCTLFSYLVNSKSMQVRFPICTEQEEKRLKLTPHTGTKLFYLRTHLNITLEDKNVLE